MCNGYRVRQRPAALQLSLHQYFHDPRFRRRLEDSWSGPDRASRRVVSTKVSSMVSNQEQMSPAAPAAACCGTLRREAAPPERQIRMPPHTLPRTPGRHDLAAVSSHGRKQRRRRRVPHRLSLHTPRTSAIQRSTHASVLESVDEAVRLYDRDRQLGSTYKTRHLAARWQRRQRKMTSSSKKNYELWPKKIWQSIDEFAMEL